MTWFARSYANLIPVVAEYCGTGRLNPATITTAWPPELHCDSEVMSVVSRKNRWSISECCSDFKCTVRAGRDNHPDGLFHG